MNYTIFKLLIRRLFLVFTAIIVSLESSGQSLDWRNLKNAISEIPDENYCDQPYLLKTKSGAWLCVMTTGPGEESNDGQHIVMTTTTDQGKTWSPLHNIEKSDGHYLSSWAVPYITPSGRIYVFYNYNGDAITHLDGKKIGSGLLGWYCFKYSDDDGQTWSDRNRINMPITVIDRLNDFGGNVQRFWGVSKPFSMKDTMYVSFTKLGKSDPKKEKGEGWLLKSSNINHEKDPNSIKWEFLPSADIGTGIISSTMGNVQEEHISVGMNNGSIYCVFRTDQGYIGETYSKNGGTSWTTIEPVRYASSNTIIKNPRACPRVFKCKNGKYLLWHHNHGLVDQWKYRNPVWLSGGIEKEGKIHWSQPELLFFDSDTTERISYPDLIEEDGKYWFTETQKKTARIHLADAQLIAGLWHQVEGYPKNRKNVTPAPVVRYDSKQKEHRNLSQNLPIKQGFTIMLEVNIKDYQPGETIGRFNFNDSGKITITHTSTNTLRLELTDGINQWNIETDPGVLSQRANHKVAFVYDNDAGLGWSVVNGKIGDGGLYHTRGWQWINQKIEMLNVEQNSLINLKSSDAEKSLSIYDKPLSVSQTIYLQNHVL